MKETTPVGRRTEYFETKTPEENQEYFAHELQDIFSEIQNMEFECDTASKTERLNSVALIMDYSINDGVYLAESLNLQPLEWQNILQQLNQSPRNQDFMKKFGKYTLSKMVDIAYDVEGAKIDVDSYKSKLQDLLGETSFNESNYPTSDRLIQKELREKIDNYYSEFLGSRFSVEETVRDGGVSFAKDYLKTTEQKPIDETLQQYFENIRPAVEKNYYSFSIRNKLVQSFKEFKPDFYLSALDDIRESEYYADIFDEKGEIITYLSDDKKDRFNRGILEYVSTLRGGDAVINQILFNPFVSKDSLSQLEGFFFENTDNFIEDISSYRFQRLDIVHNVERSSLERRLIQDIQREVKNKYGEGYSLVLNSEKGIYELKDTQVEKRKLSEEESYVLQNLTQELNGFIIDLKQQHPDLYHAFENNNLEEAQSYIENNNTNYKKDSYFSSFLSFVDEHMKETTNKFDELMENRKPEVEFVNIVSSLIQNNFDHLAISEFVHNNISEILKTNNSESLGIVLEYIRNNSGFDEDVYEKVSEYEKIVSEGKDYNTTQFESIDLLNAVHNPTQDALDKYAPKEQEVKSFNEEFKEWVEHSKEFWERIKRAIKSAPQTFLDSFAAKNIRSEHRVMDKIMFHAFPDLAAEIEKARVENRDEQRNGWNFGNGSRTESMNLQVEDYMTWNNGVGYQGGDPSNLEQYQEKIVVTSDQPLDQYIVRGKFASEKNGFWTRSNLVIDGEPEGPTRTVKYKTAVSRPGVCVLLKPMHAKLNKDSIMDHVSEDSFGVDVSTLENGDISVKKETSGSLEYELDVPVLPQTPANITNQDLESFRLSLISQEADDYIESVPGLPQDVIAFAKSLESLPPKERIIKVENYVRAIGYYDMDNGDVASHKRGVSSEDLFYLMEDRMNQIKSQKKDIDWQGKRFAGVCDDFSKFTTAILREAGIPAGIFTCFSSSGKKETGIAQAHAASYVVLPDQKGRTQSYIVDGTPPGFTPEQVERMEEMGIAPQTLEEKEVEKQQKIAEIKQESNKKLEEIQEILENPSPENIIQITPRDIERVINTMIEIDSKNIRMDTLKHLMNSFRFSPIKNINFNNLGERIEAMRFFESELNRYGTHEKSRVFETKNDANFLQITKSIVKEVGMDGFYAMLASLQGILSNEEQKLLQVSGLYMKKVLKSQQ